ncbi:MAG TPA: peptidoglycan editing factor PgeF [Tissierellaceae bacterium]|nr:peptidoglycan editing factor PgeF [Tissierellaceae bacterium]
MKTIKKIKNNKLYFEIKDFNVDNHMIHLFSTRKGWEQNNLRNNVSEILSIPMEKVYNAKQVHGTDIKIINNQSRKLVSNENYDGLITNKRGIALCTYHADCAPIYFYDKNKKVIGLAHSGWKGSLNNISRSMILIMKGKYGSKVEDILVAIGPSIGDCCYEVKEDVASMFEEIFLNDFNNRVIIKRENRIYLNLWEANRINLLKLGIKKENIILSEICTSCNINEFFSYRKEKGTKNRMIAAITLRRQTKDDIIE